MLENRELNLMCKLTYLRLWSHDDKNPSSNLKTNWSNCTAQRTYDWPDNFYTYWSIAAICFSHFSTLGAFIPQQQFYVTSCWHLYRQIIEVVFKRKWKVYNRIWHNGASVLPRKADSMYTCLALPRYYVMRARVIHERKNSVFCFSYGRFLSKKKRKSKGG